MEMTRVKSCEVIECAYNADQKCHALAITIGDLDNPMCDTFCQSSTQGGHEETIAGVGACKVGSCAHNHCLECDCESIDVGYQEAEIDCLSFMTA
ncbi:MAG: DUF1540 domain-containing protein [Planctomycetota bacterium]|jgi:hypothetical protein